MGKNGFTLVELLVSLLLFASVMAMLVGLNSFPGELAASRETEARNQVQDGVRSVMAEITSGLRQAGGDRNSNGVADVNCLDPDIPCLTVGLQDSNDQDSNFSLLGFRFLDVDLDDDKKDVSKCEQAWYKYEDEVISQRRISKDKWVAGGGDSDSRKLCAGVAGSGSGNGPDGADPLIRNVLGANITIMCRTPGSSKTTEAKYDTDDSQDYDFPECQNEGGENDPAWYPAAAIVSVFAASEAQNLELQDRSAYRADIGDSPPDSPRCLEAVSDLQNPGDGVVPCPLGSVCYCQEEKVELPNFRYLAFP